MVDSLALPPTTRAVLDLALEASPEGASGRQRRLFQTALLNLLMEHLLAADVLLGDQAALSSSSGGSYAHLAANVFYLCGRVVDKLWQGEFKVTFLILNL